MIGFRSRVIITSSTLFPVLRTIGLPTAGGVVHFVCCNATAYRTLFPMLITISSISAFGSTVRRCGFGVITSRAISLMGFIAIRRIRRSVVRLGRSHDGVTNSTGLPVVGAVGRPCGRCRVVRFRSGDRAAACADLPVLSAVR